MPVFILCGLPIRRLPAGTLTYTRRNGRGNVGTELASIWPGPTLLLWLATQAVRRQSPVIEFESAAQILN